MCQHDGDVSLDTGGLLTNVAVLRSDIVGCYSTVMATTIIVECTLPRPKNGCDGGYEPIVVGLYVVVIALASLDLSSSHTKLYMLPPSSSCVNASKGTLHLGLHLTA